MKEFFVEYNQLSDIPENFENLTNLERFGLSGNQFTEIPNVIGTIPNLKQFFANYNQLSDIPENFESLTNLERLELSGNEFIEIPDVIWTLTNLYKLTISDNPQISFIPSDIGKLNKLTDLEIGFNQISTLPEAIWGITTLEHLYFGHNQLSSLPSTIGQLSNLKQLLVSNNYLTTLPEEIGTLTDLIKIDVSNNQLSVLPNEIDNLENLTTLYLSSNELTELPTMIKEANNLNNFFLENNRFDFSDLEPIAQKNYNCPPWFDDICLIYSPQAEIGDTKIDTLQLGATFEATVSAGGTTTSYQWFKDGEIMEDSTNSTLTLKNIDFTDAGIYTCEAKNKFADELILVSEPQTLMLIAKKISINQNGGGNYNSIQAAIDDLATGNIELETDESIIFEIEPNSGPYEEQIIIPEIEGTSPTFTININGNGNTLTFDDADCENPAILQIDGADFVVINDLNIEAKVGANATWGIHLKNEADNVKIINCIFEVNSTATDTCFAGIVASNSDNTFLDNSLSLGKNANSTTIQNCSFEGGYAAIAMIGSSDTTMLGPTILNNVVRDAFQSGILVTFSNGAVVNDNVIDMTNFDVNGAIVPSGNESTSIAYKCVVGQLQDYFKKQAIDSLAIQQGFPVQIQNNHLSGIEYRGIDINDCYKVG
ncbi:MAG: leucine-rich repeat domain-containing protein, partial [Chitinophagales bacterium]